MLATINGIIFLLMTSLSLTNGWLNSPHYTQDENVTLVFIADFQKKSIFMATLTDNTPITELKYVKLSIGSGNTVTTIRYDMQHRWLYWSDYFYPMTANKDSIDSSVRSTTVIQGKFVSSMDLDESCHTLYFTEFSYWNAGIRKADVTDGAPNVVVINGPSDSVTNFVYGVKYDKIFRRIVWTNGKTVLSRDTDSWIGEDTVTQEEVVHVGEDANIRDIYLDHAECRIYWFTEQGVIESVDLNGTDRRVHFTSPSQTYQIQVLRKIGDVMYFGDTTRQGLGAINLTTGAEVAYVLELQKDGGGTFDLLEVRGMDFARTEFVDYCCGITCHGGGTCVIIGTEANCICTPNLNGTQCELDVDECSADPFPCDLTHGVCTNTHGSYSCGCQSGYWIVSGIRCIGAQNCDSNDACLNDGTCLNDTCICLFGFIGSNCELVDCEINPCKIGSTCSNGECLCQPGFQGSTCESIDCNNDPCMNGAVCENDSCVCPDGYIGLTCWYKIPPRTVHNVVFADADPH